MAGTGPTDLETLAEEFLDAVVEALDTIPSYDASLAGSPDRAFVSAGVPAIDCCEQVTVHVAPISEGASAPAVPKASVARINHVNLLATFSRCVPTATQNMTPPEVADQQAAAEQINADKWAVWNHIYNLINNGMLFDKCCDVIWGSLSPLPLSGACGGSTLSLTVCVDGYEETFGT